VYKKILILLIYFLITSCTNKTIYSGKILNQDNLGNINFKNKETLIKKMGKPSFIDPLENKFFYYSEKEIKKSIFKRNTNYSLMFVFEFDEEENIINSKVFDLKNKENVDFIDEETSNEIVRRGLLERIFGGIGAQQELPNSP
tara:strand:+ start:129 stop:557 length:429 start_codon:yes stop_codon:yes gene_type:complete